MKAKIAEFVAHCDTCQRIKAEYQRPTGLLKPLDLPVWKWDDVNMSFVMGLPRTQERNDAIWVIWIDRQVQLTSYLSRLHIP
jgi:hypothetical protein